jgi:23S rRNA pseudouridine2605 synthase
MNTKSSDKKSGERIAKVMARAGVASRRQAEVWIADGRVSVNGEVILSPALNVTRRDEISIDGQPLPIRARTRLFLYHKPRGLVTTHSDPEGRLTLFEKLPKHLPRLISIGRLDINTEGLLLLTNDGGLARVLELPATAWIRSYRVRALGRVTQDELDQLRKGVTLEGMRYGPIEATLDREQGANIWLTFSIREGKNREVRKVLESLGLKVNRLIRTSYGPFELGALDEGEVKEIETAELRKILGPQIITQAKADFDSPLEEKTSSRHPEVRAKRASKGDVPSRSSTDLGFPRDQNKSRQVGQGQPAMGRLRRPPQDDGGNQSRGKRKKQHYRHDRSGGPRPKYPRPRA